MLYFFFCDSKDIRASLFIINRKDVGLRFAKERKYIVEQGDFRITFWNEAELVYAMCRLLGLGAPDESQAA